PIKADAIGRSDVRALLDRIVDRGSPIQANRTLALVRKIFNFGIGHDIVPVNPCHQMPRPSPENVRDRVLSPDELRTLWEALEGLGPQIGSLFRLYAFTAQRGGELITMRWDDVDLETAWWNIPGERTKNRRPHRVPLTAQVVGIISR